MERKYILHTSSGAQLVTESQAIANALEQEKSGIVPRYAFRDYRTGGKSYTARLACMVNLCGWLRGGLSSQGWKINNINRLAR